MTTVLHDEPFPDHRLFRDWSWTRSFALYLLFAAAVFAVHGMQPLLGPDHVAYFQLADEIIAKRPAGDYWHETDSVRSFGVILAYLHAWTGSHLLSMKLLLAATTVAYLAAAELFFGLFASRRWQAILLALLSAFAVSFGISSWGVTDSTALLARTIVAPIVMFCLWMWFRFRDGTLKYLVFPILICGSLLHLSTFYVIGILSLLEAWDFAANRRFRLDRRVAAFIAAGLASLALLYGFERMGVSVKVLGMVVPGLLAPRQVEVEPIAPKSASSKPSAPPAAGPAAAPAPPPAAPKPTAQAKAKEAWEIELALRSWRNMPMPAASFANLLSSSLIILALALWGMAQAWRAGFNDADRAMCAMFVAVPLFSFGPQTALWILRSFTNVHPISLEEVRAIGFIMVPALYFVLRLIQFTAARPRHAGLGVAAIVAAFLALPLALKSLPDFAREGILELMIAVGAVDEKQPSSLNNARAALGIAYSTPFYYSVIDSMEWLRRNTPPGSRILTDRDEFLLLAGWEIVGPRQVAAVPSRTATELPSLSVIFFETKEAIRSHDTARVARLAATYDADYFVVPWPVEGAAYRDRYFSVVPVPEAAK